MLREVQCISRSTQKHSLALHCSSTNSAADTDPIIFISVHSFLLELEKFSVGKGVREEGRESSLTTKIPHSGRVKN